MSHESIPEKKDSPEMFSLLAGKYDFINRVLSFGLDTFWKKKLVRGVPKGHNLFVLDIATGTGDVIFELGKRKDVERGIGLDPSSGMLKRAADRLLKRNNPAVSFKLGAAEQLPFDSSSFDAITISFGIRNTVDPLHSLKEMHRVLKPGGTVHILEFSIPKNPIIKRFHIWYLHHIIPRLGNWLSGHSVAYTYLYKTIKSFPHGSGFLSLMKRAGFEETKQAPLTFGAVTIYSGKKAINR